MESRSGDQDHDQRDAVFTFIYFTPDSMMIPKIFLERCQNEMHALTEAVVSVAALMTWE